MGKIGTKEYPLFSDSQIIDSYPPPLTNVFSVASGEGDEDFAEDDLPPLPPAVEELLDKLYGINPHAYIQASLDLGLPASLDYREPNCDQHGKKGGGKKNGSKKNGHDLHKDPAPPEATKLLFFTWDVLIKLSRQPELKTILDNPDSQIFIYDTRRNTGSPQYLAAHKPGGGFELNRVLDAFNQSSRQENQPFNGFVIIIDPLDETSSYELKNLMHRFSERLTPDSFMVIVEKREPYEVVSDYRRGVQAKFMAKFAKDGFVQVMPRQFTVNYLTSGIWPLIGVRLANHSRKPAKPAPQSLKEAPPIDPASEEAHAQILELLGVPIERDDVSYTVTNHYAQHSREKNPDPQTMLFDIDVHKPSVLGEPQSRVIIKALGAQITELMGGKVCLTFPAPSIKRDRAIAF